MEIRDMRYFCLTAELGNVTRAAEQLQVSQPFVTKVIHQLEDELGVKLFGVVKRRLVLTEKGEYFYKECRDILNHLDGAVDNLKTGEDDSEFAINLLYNNAGYLSALNNAFMDKYPNARLSEAYAKREDIIDKLNGNQADFAIELPPIRPDESSMIETMTVLKDTGSIMVPEDHPLFEKEVVTLEDLAGYPVIIAPKGSGMRATIDHIFDSHNLPLNVVYETNDMDLQQRMVLVNKKGIAFMSIIHTQDPLIGKYCRKTKTDECFGVVGLSFNKYRQETENTKIFRQFALEFFGNLQKLADSI